MSRLFAPSQRAPSSRLEVSEVRQQTLARTQRDHRRGNAAVLVVHRDELGGGRASPAKVLRGWVGARVHRRGGRRRRRIRAARSKLAGVDRDGVTTRVESIPVERRRNDVPDPLPGEYAAHAEPPAARGD